MKELYLLVGILTGLGVAASILLIPRQQELALMYFKDKRFEEAKQAYEEQLAKGELDSGLISRLVDLYLQYGHIDQAIAVMEKYIGAHPADMAARKELGMLYQYAQRPDDYLRNLEELSRLNPDKETLLTLLDIYNFNAQYDKQIAALRELIEKQEDAEPAHYMKLAELLASRKSYQETAETLLALRKAHPDAVTFPETELLVSVLLDLGRKDEALVVADEWRAKAQDTKQVARLANLLHYKGSSELAARLLTPYGEQLQHDPALLLEYVLILMSDGHDEEAYRLLSGLHQAAPLTGELAQKLLFLAAARRDEKTVNGLLATLDLRALTEPQAIAVAELAALRGNQALLQGLGEAFPAEEYAETSSVLIAVLALARQDPLAPRLLSDTLARDLTQEQMLQLARSCVRARQPACAEQLASKLATSDRLSDTEIAGVADIYLELKQPEKGYAFLFKAGNGRDSELLRRVRIKYAMALGQTDAIKAWLRDEAQHAESRFLTELYFTAMRYGQPALAAAAAEAFHRRENTSTSRSYLAYAYIKNEKYAEVLALLRDSRELTEDDENSYLTALIKLAPQEPAYREELVDYAFARLSGDLPEKRKLALLYALVNANQPEVALLHIKDLALERGGEWAALYANYLDKHGRYEEARSFWLKLVASPTTSALEKRQIAHSLLARGYKQDALQIFAALAQDTPAESDDVKQLLYLWGPRLTEAQLDWLAARMQRAGTEKEKDAWAAALAAHAGAEEMVALAGKRPELLVHPRTARAVMEALHATGQLAARQAEIVTLARENGQTEALRAYARVADETGNDSLAVSAFGALAKLAPDGSEALRKAGLIAFRQADFSASQEYLTRYIDALESDTFTDPNAYQAYFHRAELRRRDLKPEDTAPFYEKTLQHIANHAPQSADTASKAAQSLVWLGCPGEGFAAFEKAMQRYPGNAVLHADYASTLIEQKRYAKARAQLDHRHIVKEKAAAGSPIALNEANLAGHTLSAGGQEIVLRFKSEAARSGFNTKALPGWVSYASEGYDTLLLAARPGYRMQVEYDPGGTLRIAPVLDLAAASSQEARQTYLRYELLAARIELETGKQYDAVQRLRVLEPSYPGDVQLMVYAANAENFSGNWHRAQALLTTARRAAPKNEDIEILYRDIRKLHAPHVTLDHEWVRRGDHREHITTLEGYVNATPSLQAGAMMQNDHVDAENVRRADGRIGNFKDHKQRGEFYLARNWEDGRRLKGSLFANNDTPGAGAYLSWINRLGETQGSIEYHRPYWEFVEGTLDDATRDRIALAHQFKFNPKFTLRLEGELNRYNVEDDEDVAFTGSVNLQAIYQLRPARPYLAVGYGLDAEYGIDKEFRIDANGLAYKPFPFVSREVHFVSLIASHAFTEATEGDLLLGYGYDRLGGHGPTVEARLTHELNEHLDLQLSAFYGLDTASTRDDDITRLGIYVRWRF
jgi:tetratricopeptide (TPR) repeat protein